MGSYVRRALLCAMVLVACDEDDDAEAPILQNVLSGESEVPPVTTTATGTVQVRLDDRRLELTGSFSGLMSNLLAVQGSAAHIHEAPRGQNGPIVVNVVVNSSDQRSGTLSLTTDLTDAQAQALRDGRLYINVHTMRNPGGELRAQLAPP